MAATLGEDRGEVEALVGDALMDAHSNADSEADPDDEELEDGGRPRAYAHVWPIQRYNVIREECDHSCAANFKNKSNSDEVVDYLTANR